MKQETNNSTLVLTDYAENAYLQYAIATVKDRALAEVDGNKPVQRRILFTMRQLGLNHTAKPVKSARIVGDVLGKYHPHGDTSVYDAMVRMSQPFTLRYPLIIGQGNFGSRDGDPAAAMRYTEARLSSIADLLLDELGRGTVDFNPNYDGSLEEPKLLPARLPFVLLNGTMGIAVGMAASIPSHNLTEIVKACCLVVNNENITLDEILDVLPGPDFPDGAQLISSKSDIKTVYETGRGPIRCRATWIKEDLARNQWQIVITQMPYQVSTKKILEELDALTNPQISSGKKALTQEQANLKQLSLEYLEKAVDESDKSNPVRLVIVPRSNKLNPEQVIHFLMANTSLESNFSVNITMVGLDGKPQSKNLLTILKEWAQFRFITVTKRTQHELSLAQKRKHILEGRVIAFNNLEAVVRIVRTSEDPQKELMATFKLTEEQTNDILEMKLRQLNKLEGLKLLAELKDLEVEISRCSELLASNVLMKKLIIKELEADGKKYGDERRTVIKEEAKIVAKSSTAVSVLDEPITIVLSKNLWIKAYKGHNLDKSSFQFKTTDSLLFSIESSSVNSVVVLDTKGRVYSFEASLIPSTRGEGLPLSTFIDLQDNSKVCSILSSNLSDIYLFAGQRGYGFLSEFKNLMSRAKAGKAFLSLEPNELPFAPILKENIKTHLMCESTESRLLCFELSELKSYDKGGKGLMLIDLPEFIMLKNISMLENLSEFSFNYDNKPILITNMDRYLNKRGRKGAIFQKEKPLKN